MRNQQASLRNLEHHVAQIAKSLAKCPQESLLSNNKEVNPSESLKVVILRSGSKLPSPQEKQLVGVESTKVNPPLLTQINYI